MSHKVKRTINVRGYIVFYGAFFLNAQSISWARFSPPPAFAILLLWLVRLLTEVIRWWHFICIVSSLSAVLFCQANVGYLTPDLVRAWFSFFSRSCQCRRQSSCTCSSTWSRHCWCWIRALTNLSAYLMPNRRAASFASHKRSDG